MKSLFVAIALVAACSVANAAEVKKDTTKAPAVSAKAMTDKDMDNVTAGAISVDASGITQEVGGGGRSYHRLDSNGFLNSKNSQGACFNAGQCGGG